MPWNLETFSPRERKKQTLQSNNKKIITTYCTVFDPDEGTSATGALPQTRGLSASGEAAEPDERHGNSFLQVHLYSR